MYQSYHVNNTGNLYGSDQQVIVCQEQNKIHTNCEQNNYVDEDINELIVLSGAEQMIASTTVKSYI